jgi:hypothetical protein
VQNPWILEELAAQRRLDVNLTAERRWAAASSRPTRRSLVSACLAKAALSGRGGLFAKRNGSEAPLAVTPRLLQKRQVGR